MQLGATQHIPLRPLNIDIMDRHDGRWGKDEWYPAILRGWYDMWWDRAQSRLMLEMVVGGVRPSRQYLLGVSDGQAVCNGVKASIKLGRIGEKSSSQVTDGSDVDEPSLNFPAFRRVDKDG
ncbi:hypothetical protein PIB30_031194 [Stylosanthes scabra]|uniref:Uncharacterized protein n=1 Tax=Stylosanthes scabra TaxID=79078 RepID=A0ABU6RC34_9FABA|nr:hypothetical protein [Stylosanthes scabra]